MINFPYTFSKWGSCVKWVNFPFHSDLEVSREFLHCPCVSRVLVSSIWVGKTVSQSEHRHSCCCSSSWMGVHWEWQPRFWAPCNLLSLRNHWAGWSNSNGTPAQNDCKFDRESHLKRPDVGKLKNVISLQMGITLLCWELWERVMLLI